MKQTNNIQFADAISRTVTKGIYHTEDCPGGGKRTIKDGETSTTYEYAASVDNDYIRLNGKIYPVKHDYEFSIKIQKTQIRATNGASGLIKFLTTFQNKVSDGWEQKIIDNCRALN